MKISREPFNNDGPFSNCWALCWTLDNLLRDDAAAHAALCRKISNAVIAAIIKDMQETGHLEALLEDRERTLQDHYDRGLIPDWRRQGRKPLE